MEDFKIELGVELKNGALDSLKTQIEGKKFNPIKINIDTSNVQKQIDSIKTQLQNLGKIKIDLTGANSGSGGNGASRTVSDAKAAFNELKNIQQRMRSLKLTLGGLDSNKNSQQIAELNKQINSLQSNYDALSKKFSGQFSTKQMETLQKGIQLTADKLEILKAKMQDVSAIKTTTGAYKELMSLAGKMNTAKIAIAGLDKSKNSQEITELETQLKTLETVYGSLEAKFKGQLSTEQFNKLTAEIDKGEKAVERLKARMADTTATEEQRKAFQKLFETLKQAESLEVKIRNLKNQGGHSNEVVELEKDYNNLMNTYNNMLSSLNKPLSTEQWEKINTEIAKTQEQLTVLDSKALDAKQKLSDSIKLKLSDGTIENQIDSIVHKFENLGMESQDMENKIAELRNLMSNMDGTDDIESVTSDYEKYNQTLVETNNLFDKLKRQQEDERKREKESIAQQDLANGKASLSSDIDVWLKYNTAAAKNFGSQLADIKSRIQSADKVTLGHLRAEFKEVTNQAKIAGQVGLSLGDKLREQANKLGVYFSATMTIMKTVGAIKDGIHTVVELDDALVDLKKTTTMTASELNNFYKEANSVAKDYGATTKEIIESAANWSRLGYSSKQEASTMAKLSSMMATISPGMTVEEATTGLVSVMKAYGIDAENVLDGVMSKINAVGKVLPLKNYIG